MFSLIALAVNLLLSALAGYLAAHIMGLRSNWIINIVLGVIGGFVGSLLAGSIGISASGFSIGGVAISVAGACVVVWLYKKLK